MKIGANQEKADNSACEAKIEKIGKTAAQRKVTLHSAGRNVFSGIWSKMKLLSSYKISSAAVNTIKMPSINTNTPGAKVVGAANEMVGRYQWGPPAMNVDGAKNGLEELVKRGQPVTEQSRLNCWESILQAGMKSGVLPEDKLVNWMKNESAMDCDIDYTEKITELFGMSGSVPMKDTVVEPGDILLFYGNSHVALSVGGDDMLHLPNNSTFEQTSVEQFIASVKSDDRRYVAFLKNGAETICSVSDREVSVETYNKICDFSEAVADLKSGSISQEIYALTKENALTTFSGEESQLAVRVIKNPWGKMLDILEKSV